MNRSEATKVIAVLKATYPQWRPEPGAEVVWAELLVDTEYRLVDAAIRRLILSRASQWPPSIGEIHAECTRMAHPELLDSPEEAWGEVIQQIRAVGWCGRPQFSSDVVRQAVQAIGWRELCQSEQGDSGIRAHFFRTFAAYKARRMEDAGMPDRLRIGAVDEVLRLED